ncbi:hypothetical protein J4477_01445 [Candidatus Pacearchaeota archaeon]|nr:hypothetical protein [Candidatus Pacearchaeota archaeon]
MRYELTRENQASRLFVIVHDGCEIDLGRYPKKRVESVKKEIRRIRDEEVYIDNQNCPDSIPADLNDPNNSLDIYVAGYWYGGYNWCVNRQANALRKVGYNARIYIPGSLKVNIPN